MPLRFNLLDSQASSFAPAVRDGEADEGAILGGPHDWFWAYPNVVKALAAPSVAAVVPALPREPDMYDPAKRAALLGYYAPLHLLLLHHLGWEQPHRGLARWYDAGKPTEEPVLALIEQVWGKSGALDNYFAWLLRERLVFAWDRSEGLLPAWEGGSEERGAGESLHDEPAGILRPRLGDPFHGGWNPPHLDAYQLSTSGLTGGRIVESDEQSRKAIYLGERADSWYRDLMQESALPPAAPSWRVDVWVKSLGYLGTFCRSRETGRWFQGHHSWHIAGALLA